MRTVLASAALVLALGGCGGPRIRDPWERPNTSDPGMEAVRAEALSLPFKEEVWSHQFKDWKIARISLGAEYLYLETPDCRVAAVDRRTGVPAWVFQVDSGTPIDWVPSEASGVPEEIRELEGQIRGLNRQIDDVIKAEGPGAKSQALTRDRNNARQKLTVAQQGDNVYFCSRQVMYCLVRTTGTLLWKKRLNFAPSGRPFATRNYIFVPGADLARVWRLDVEKRGEETSYYPATMGSGDRSIVTRPVFHTSLYFVAGDGNAYSYDVDGGRLNWTYPTLDKLAAEPVIHERAEKYLDSAGKEGTRKKRYLLIGGLDYALYALDADNGKLEWKYETAGYLKSAAVVKDDTVYVKTEGGSLFALEIDPQHRDPKTGAAMGTRRNGQLRWKLPLGERFLVKGSDSVLVLGPKDEVYQVREKTGEIVGRTQLNQIHYVLTNTQDGMLYVATGAGHVFALKESGEKY